MLAPEGKSTNAAAVTALDHAAHSVHISMGHAVQDMHIYRQHLVQTDLLVHLLQEWCRQLAPAGSPPDSAGVNTLGGSNSSRLSCVQTDNAT